MLVLQLLVNLKQTYNMKKLVRKAVSLDVKYKGFAKLYSPPDGSTIAGHTYLWY